MKTKTRTQGAAEALLDDAIGQLELRERQYRENWGKKYGVDPGKPTRTISQWSDGILWSCAHRYFLERVLGVRQAQRPLYFVFGDSFDVGFSQWMSTGEFAEGLRAFHEDWAAHKGEIDWSQERWDPAKWATIGETMLRRLEEPMRGVRPLFVQHSLDRVPIVNPLTGEALEGFAFSGKLDLVDESEVPEREGDTTVVTDLKTAASITPQDDRYLVTKTSLQLLIYAYSSQYDELLRDLPGVGETVSFLQAQKTLQPRSSPGWARTWADLTEEDFVELFHHAKAHAAKVSYHDALLEAGEPPHRAWPKNRNACMGEMNNRPCPMLALCRPELFPDADPTSLFTTR